LVVDLLPHAINSSQGKQINLCTLSIDFSCVGAELSVMRVLAKECVEPSADQNDNNQIATGPDSNEPLVQRQWFDQKGLRKRKDDSSTVKTTENIELSNGTQIAQQKSVTIAEQEEFMVSWRRILLLIMGKL
jgi:hypothetical protein